MATSLRTYERIAQALSSSSFSSLKRVNLWNERSVCDSKTSNRTLSNNNERAMDDGTKSSRPKSDLWFSRQKAKADEQWFEQFEKLKLYKDTHGDCMVPNSYTDDFSLRGKQDRRRRRLRIWFLIWKFWSVHHFLFYFIKMSMREVLTVP